MKRLAFIIAPFLALAAVSCNQIEDPIDITPSQESTKQTMDFDITVTRDGQMFQRSVSA